MHFDSSFWESFHCLVCFNQWGLTLWWPPPLITHICHLLWLPAIMKQTQTCLQSHSRSFHISRTWSSRWWSAETLLSPVSFPLPLPWESTCTVDAGSTTHPGSLSLWEDELAVSHRLSVLWCDMICGRLNSRAMQSSPKTAECYQFGECVYVVSPQQGHFTTPTSPAPTVLHLVSRSLPPPSKAWWTGCVCH